MKLRDYLAIPYMIEAAPAEGEGGHWVRRLRYPELGDFHVDTIDVETGLRELEIRRIREIVRIVKAGERPPVPRPPLRSFNPEWQARSLGVWELVADSLDADVDPLAPAAGTRTPSNSTSGGSHAVP